MKSISQGTVERAHQVGEEQHGALQHADHHQVAARVVAADLGAELGDPPLQVVGRDQDLADRGVVHRAARLQRRDRRDRPLGRPAPRTLGADAHDKSAASPRTTDSSERGGPGATTQSSARAVSTATRSAPGRGGRLRDGDAGHPGDLAADGDDREGRAHRARHAPVGEQVAERLGARHARAGGCGRPGARCGPRSARAARPRRASRGRGRPGSTGPGWSSARTSQPPSRARPGRPSATGAGAGVDAPRRESGRGPTRRSRRARRRARPSPPSGSRGEPHDLRGARAAERDLPARGALGERAQGQPAQAGLPVARAPRPGSRRRRRRRRPRRAPRATTPLEQRRLLGELGAGLGDVALGRRVELAQHRAAPRRGSGCGRRSGRRWSRRRRTAARRSATSSRTRSRSSPSSGRTTRPLRGAQPEQRPRARARPRAGRAAVSATSVRVWPVAIQSAPAAPRRRSAAS